MPNFWIFVYMFHTIFNQTIISLIKQWQRDIVLKNCSQVMWCLIQTCYLCIQQREPGPGGAAATHLTPAGISTWIQIQIQKLKGMEMLWEIGSVEIHS